MRLRGRARNARRELAAIPDHLLAEFSQRTAAITAAKDAAIDTFGGKHHRQPTGPEAVRTRQQATLETRQPKHASTLAESTEQWTRRANLILGTDARAWARAVTAAASHANVGDTAQSRMATSSLVDEQTVEVLAAAALDQVEARRATWSRWNLVAAMSPTIGSAGLPFATEAYLRDVRRRVAGAVIAGSVLLNPANTLVASAEIDAATGRSIFDAPEVFTSLEVLAAEEAPLRATASAPTVSGYVSTVRADSPPGCVGPRSTPATARWSWTTTPRIAARPPWTAGRAIPQRRHGTFPGARIPAEPV